MKKFVLTAAFMAMLTGFVGAQSALAADAQPPQSTGGSAAAPGQTPNDAAIRGDYQGLNPNEQQTLNNNKLPMDHSRTYTNTRDQQLDTYHRTDAERQAKLLDTKTREEEYIRNHEPMRFESTARPAAQPPSHYAVPPSTLK